MSQFNVLRSSTSPDQIYFDVIATNLEDDIKPAPKFYYNERREVPFVEKPEDYYLTIDRFTCETNSLPVFIPTIASPTQQGRDFASADINRTIYTVTIQLVDRTTDPPQYGDYFTVPIVWIPQDQSAPKPSFLANGSQDNTGGYYNCYSFAYLTYLVQESLNTAFLALDKQLLNRSTPIVNPATMPPTFTWDADRQKAYFCVETKGYVMGGDYFGSATDAASYQRNIGVANSDITTISKASDNLYDMETTVGNAIAKINPQILVGGGSSIANWFQNGWNNFTKGVTSAGRDIKSAVTKLSQGKVGATITEAGKTITAVSSAVPFPITQSIGDSVGHSLEHDGELITDETTFKGTPIQGSANSKSKNSIKVTLPSTGLNPVYPKPLYSGANRVLEVFFNAPLYQLFNSFPAFSNGYDTELSTGHRNYRLIFPNLNGIGETLITPTFALKSLQPVNVTTVYQEYSTVATISPITSIVFCSNTLPIVPNLVSTPLIYNNSRQISKAGVDAAFANIITDLASMDGNYRPYLVYIPSAQYRYISLLGNQPLYNLDLSIFYRTKFGELIPFTLSSGCSVTMKMAFIKKSSAGA